MNFDDFLMVKITKKVDIMKKFRFFPKVKVMIGTVTKYELLTPRELEDIQNLAKTFLLQNICVSTQIHAGGVCGCSVVLDFTKTLILLKPTLVLAKGCSAPGQRPSKNPQLFNISLVGLTKFCFSS